MVQHPNKEQTIRAPVNQRVITDTRLVFNEDAHVYRYVSYHNHGIEFDQPVLSVGVHFPNDFNQIMGGVVFYELRPERMVSLACAGMPGWLSKARIKEFFKLAFGTMGVSRINSVVALKNQNAIKFNQRLGFVMEGQIRESLPDGDDAVVFGMLKKECKWL